LGNLTPKGPGAAGLTATARATPSPLATCPTFSAVPPPTTAWKVYKDSRFPFSFAIPPGWQAGAFTPTTADPSNAYYTVLVLPPDSTAPFSFAGQMTAPESFSLRIVLSGALPDFSHDPAWTAELHKIHFGGVPTTLFERSASACGELDRATDDVKFGQLSYSFYYQTTLPSRAKNDVALFLGSIQSFIYPRY